MIRKMKDSDIDEIVKDEVEIFGESLGDSMLKNELSNQNALYLVLEEDNKILGYIGLWINLDNAQILNFYIKKDYRNQGFGSTLLKEAIKNLEDNGVKIISLEVRESNLNAIDLYEKFNFRMEYKRKYYYKDGEDAHVYVRRI